MVLIPKLQEWIYIINFGFSVGLLLIIVSRKNEIWSRLLILLAAILTVGTTLTLLTSYGLLSLIRTSTLENIPYYVALLTSAVYMFITFSFTRSTTWKSLRLFFAIVMIVSITLTVELFRWTSDNHLRPTFEKEIFITGWGIFMSISILHMLFAYRRSFYPLHRNRYKYWFLVVIVFIIGSGLIFVNQIAIGLLLVTLSSLFLTLTSYSHELPDIRQIFKRATTYLLTTLLSLAAYTGAFLLFRFSSPGSSTSGMSIIFAVVFALGLVLVANPLINFFYRWVNRIISGSSLDASLLLGNYSKEISNIIQIHLLAWEIIYRVTEGMHIQNGELFTLTKNADQYTVHLVSREASSVTANRIIHKFAVDSPIARWFLTNRRAITHYDLDFHPQLVSAAQHDKEWLLDFKIDILLPIFSQDEWIGLLALGPKENGDRFFEQDLVILQSIADQTAIALRNARLYEDLKQQNIQNEKLNSELSAANDELARLDQAKSDFISIASHEIRTPLTQIIGYNDILNDMVKSGNIPRTAGLQMIEGVRKASRRLEEIVDTMFDVSKLDTRTLDLHFAKVNLENIIRASAEKWLNAIEERKLTFSAKSLNTLPLVEGDEKRLQQVFSNLFQNAIKYTPDGGQIRVTGKAIEKNPLDGVEYVEIVVADTGIGLNPEDVERIFDKFYRVGNVMLHSSGETKFKGAGPGLGLTIARGIIEAHRGKIWAESAGNDETTFPGSAFHVLLPTTQE